jgi:hypothetical protein
MMFSATVPKWVKKLVKQYMNDPVNIDLVGEGQTGKMADSITAMAVQVSWGQPGWGGRGWGRAGGLGLLAWLVAGGRVRSLGSRRELSACLCLASPAAA